jgi:hypothetical protein
VGTLATAATRNEVIITVAGAAAALGGLILVFLGVVVTGLSAYESGTAPEVLKPYRWAAGGIVMAFALSVACTALAIAWLATGSGAGALYEAAVWVFFVLLVAVLGAAARTVYLVVFS